MRVFQAIHLQAGQRRLSALVRGFVVVTITLVPGFAIAQEELGSTSPISQVPELPSVESVPQYLPPPPPPAPVRLPKLAILAAQIETFADLLGETEVSVVRRLRHDPGLVPLVAAAADARRVRQRTVRNSMILGFTTVGLGATVGLVGLLMSGPGYPGESSRPNEQSTQGHSTTDVIGLALAGLGLVTATYGIMKVAAQTDLETEAVALYRGSSSSAPLVFPPGSSRASSGGAGGSALSLSLCSFTF